MASALTEHQIDSFRRDGFVTGLQAMSAAQANAIRGELEAFESSSGAPLSSAFRQKSHLLFPWVADLVRCELSRGQEVAVDIGDQQPGPLELEPGQFSLHHVRLVHGSLPNRSTDRRIGFAMRFIPTSIYQRDASRDSAVLVRGVDDFGHFEHEPLATSLLALAL